MKKKPSTGKLPDAKNELEVDDPFRYKILQCFSVCFALATISISVFSICIYIFTDSFKAYDCGDRVNNNIRYILQNILPIINSHNFEGSGIIINTIPALLITTCYHKNQNKLNKIGQLLVLIFIVGLFSGMLGMVIYPPIGNLNLFNVANLDERDRKLALIIQDIPGMDKTYTFIRQSCEQAARSSIFYLTIFFGINKDK